MSDTIAWAKPEDVGMSRERLARIGDVITADIEKGLVPGAVTVVARRGRIVHFKAYGRRDPARDEPMERDAIFRIYSMTKPLVSVALMMLVEEGRLLLSDPLSAFVPEFAEAKVRVEREGGFDLVPPARPITIHDLLRHSSGLTYEWMDDGPVQTAYAEAEAGRRSRSNAEQAALLATLPLLAHPGTEWNYSRSTDLLGRVIEVVTGLSLGVALRSRLFEPLGMMETGFVVPPNYQARIAQPFPTDPETGEAQHLLDISAEVAMENGGGGLASTTSDYARFLHMLVSGGQLDGVRFLSPRTLAYMTADHLGPEIRIMPDILPEGYGFGLGFAVRRQDGISSFPGSAGDFYWEGLGGTSFWVDPREELYGLIMVQAPGRREHYRRMMRQLVYAAIMD
ncbi:serine hydrolase domain-containing protein [Enterovirga aerilata]|uniref:Beta-lactamase family protein n=1 Tax=Enterovirga aerilata TaxID=2730920 RepID=A0A849I9Y0_9HYPH|nr:serine hydrolase domain-containing protein [Enterovirga sp. DB1703]NNM74654.1 beta-lactamase family protein [Enterovirga sp. DB1703]